MDTNISIIKLSREFTFPLIPALYNCVAGTKQTLRNSTDSKCDMHVNKSVCQYGMTPVTYDSALLESGITLHGHLKGYPCEEVIQVLDMVP